MIKDVSIHGLIEYMGPIPHVLETSRWLDNTVTFSFKMEDSSNQFIYARIN